ncbi:hypothetical protein PR048_023462 [Dryococelus australis]|uniref:C2H2-type domain-containing protein n=1 Tax=Dryococelus australis TaxID=614101 RepID=A0ABQ9GU63_9NEOP|nr:hypothetical protein PR048_023462 [Dryococelus australis]
MIQRKRSEWQELKMAVQPFVTVQGPVVEDLQADFETLIMHMKIRHSKSQFCKFPCCQQGCARTSKMYTSSVNIWREVTVAWELLVLNCHVMSVKLHQMILSQFHMLISVKPQSCKSFFVASSAMLNSHNNVHGPKKYKWTNACRVAANETEGGYFEVISLRLLGVISRSNSAVKTINRSGPRCKHCGTPDLQKGFAYFTMTQSSSGKTLNSANLDLALERNVSLLSSHQGDPGSTPGWITADFRMWESCWTMLLVGGFFRGSPVSPALSFRCYFILTLIALIGSEDLDVKSHPNIFTHSVVKEKRAFGWANKAFCWADKAFGWTNTAFGWANKAFGWANKAFVWTIKAFGWTNKAFGWTNKAFGWTNKAFGWFKKVFGWTNQAFGWINKAFGWTNQGIWLEQARHLFGSTRHLVEATKAFGWSKQDIRLDQTNTTNKIIRSNQQNISLPLYKQMIWS